MSFNSRRQLHVEQLESKTLLAADTATIAEAYVDQRARYPDLTFGEFLSRAVQGEDVLDAARNGSFLPQATQAGWLVRFEVGPMTGSELSEYPASKKVPPNTMVWDPGRKTWVRAHEITCDELPAPTV